MLLRVWGDSVGCTKHPSWSNGGQEDGVPTFKAMQSQEQAALTDPMETHWHPSIMTSPPFSPTLLYFLLFYCCYYYPTLLIGLENWSSAKGFYALK